MKRGRGKEGMRAKVERKEKRRDEHHRLHYLLFQSHFDSLLLWAVIVN